MTLSIMSKSLVRARHAPALKLHRVCGFSGVSAIVRRPQIPRELLFPDNGTGLAISYLSLGVPAHLPLRSAGRGGARNSAKRESHELSAAQVGNLIAAASHAEVIGLPLTRMITIHWGAAGVPLDGMAKATGKFIDLLTKALARHGSATAWIWTHENGDGKGWHCHMLVHVPAALVPVVARRQLRWLRIITGKSYKKKVIYSEPIGGRLKVERDNPALHAVNLQKVLFYVIKGAGEEAVTRFGLERQEPEGLVIGKRCGSSQNIGAKARSKRPAS